MSATIQDYIDVLKSPVSERVLKLQILDDDYNIIQELSSDVIDGSIQLSSGSGARRSCNITFDNHSGIYTPDPDGLFWINSRIKVLTGYKVNNEDFLFSRGIFLMGEPSVNSNFSEQIVDLQLYDLFSNLDGTLGGTLLNTYTIPQGTDLETAVRLVFQEAGESRPVIFQALDPSVQTSYTLTLESGNTYADILNRLSEMVSYVVYYDSNGFPRFEAPINDISNIVNVGSVFDFTIDENLYLGAKRRLEFSKVRNTVKVYGMNVNGTIYQATSQDTNPSSSTRVALIGEKTMVITDDLIPSNTLCQTRADYELQKSIQILESIDVECVPVDLVEAGTSVITISDSNMGVTNQRYIVNSVNFPLMNGSNMSMNVWAARSFN